MEQQFGLPGCLKVEGPVRCCRVSGLVWLNSVGLPSARRIRHRRKEGAMGKPSPSKTCKEGTNERMQLLVGPFFFTCDILPPLLLSLFFPLASRKVLLVLPVRLHFFLPLLLLLLSLQSLCVISRLLLQLVVVFQNKFTAEKSSWAPPKVNCTPADIHDHKK